MILDTLSNLKFYAPLNRRIAAVADFLQRTDLDAIADGRYEIDGEHAFMMVSRNELRKPENASLEAHDRYLDIQIVISGTESYGWQARGACVAPREAYSEQRDIIFYEDSSRIYVTLGKGDMVLFFPEDAHAPLVGEGSVRKCIVKVRCSEK